MADRVFEDGQERIRGAAPFAAALKEPPLLVYHHGMIAIASENSVLMEHLASHGFIIVAVRHLAQLQESQALQGQIPESEQKRDQAVMKSLASQISREEKATLSLAYYKSASATNLIVQGRAIDTAFVLDHLSEVVAAIPAAEEIAVNSDAVGLLGLSLGGAVATEFSKIDARGKAVVNMDGGLYGMHIEDPICVPYLMLYSAQNEGGNDLLLNNASINVVEQTIPKSKHLDFHDAVMILPILRWMGMLGRVRPHEVVQAKHEAIRTHFQKLIKEPMIYD
ncbi:MAG: hypothetical protein R2867_46885 [Caldilineaceae bacterium]